MNMTEHTLISKFHKQLASLNNNKHVVTSASDSLFIKRASLSVFNHLLAAQEPMCKPHISYNRIEVIIELMNHFIKTRIADDWSRKNSTFRGVLIGNILRNEQVLAYIYSQTTTHNKDINDVLNTLSKLNLDEISNDE